MLLRVTVHSARPRCCCCILQARAYRYRTTADLATRDQYLGCCADCKRARLRIVASLRAQAAWINDWVTIFALRLAALEQGHPKLPLVLPYLDVQPYLAEGVPAVLPASSIDRCAACQKALEQVRPLAQTGCSKLELELKLLWGTMAAGFPA